MWCPTNFPAPLTVSLPGLSLAYSTDEVLFRDGTEHDPEDQWSRAEAVPFEHPHAAAEHRHDEHVGVRVLNAVGAEHREHDDRAREVVLREQDHPCRQATQGKSEPDHQELTDEHGVDEGPGHFRIGSEEVGAREDPVDEQPAKEHRSGGAPWNAECEQGNERGADHGVVRGLGGNEALRLALAVGLRGAAELARLVVGDESCDLSTRPRHEPNDDAGNRPDRERTGGAHHLPKCLPHGVALHRRDRSAARAAREHVDDLGHGKEPHERRDDVDPAVEVRGEREAVHTLHPVVADGREPHPEAARGETLDDGA